MTQDGSRTVKLGDVARQVSAHTQDPLAEGLTRYVGLEHLDPEHLRVERWGDVSDGTTFTKRFEPGQLLFARRRAYQRKAAVADFAGVCSGDIIVIEADRKHLLPELLPYIVHSDRFLDLALKTSAGSLSPRTKWRDLQGYEFDLPPLDRQRVLVGQLTAANLCRHRHREVSCTADSVSRALLQQVVRAGHPEVRVDDLGSSEERPVVQVGPFGSSLSNKFFQPHGVPVIKIGNLPEGGPLIEDDFVFVSVEHASTLDRYRVEPGDLLTAAQATTGRSALVPASLEGAIFSQHLIRVTVDRSKMLPAFLLMCFRSPHVRRQMGLVRQKTTRDGLNTSDVASFRIPLPPMPIQHEIVDLAERIERAIAISAAQSELLRRIMDVIANQDE